GTIDLEAGSPGVMAAESLAAARRSPLNRGFDRGIRASVGLVKFVKRHGEGELGEPAANRFRRRAAAGGSQLDGLGGLGLGGWFRGSGCGAQRPPDCLPRRGRVPPSTLG